MHTKPLLRVIVFGVFMASSVSLFAQTAHIVREAANEFPSIKTIKVDGQFSKIEVLPTDGDKVVFAGKLSSDKQDDAYQLLNTAADGVLTIAIKYPAQGWTTHSGEVSLKVPSGTTLEIETTSGSVKIDGLTDANVNVISKSGSMECTKTKGNVYIESVTGVVRVSDGNGNISTKTKTGNQFISKSEGNINANSTEGEITINQTTGTLKTESTSGTQTIGFNVGDVAAKSVNGFVNISEIKGNVNIISFAGRVKLFQIKGAVDVQTTAGDQAGTRLLLTGNSSFKSTEGKITMQIDNKTDELTFNMVSTTSFMQVRGTSKKKKLKLGNGPIVITTQSTTGGQVFK
jgi:hypothetical protein